MPKLMNQSASIVGATISNFGFSAKPAQDLTATEYTLADIAIDVSPSTSDYLADLKKGLDTVAQALVKSPRALNMLVRVHTFSENLQEVHGFIPLSDIIEKTVDAQGKETFKMLIDYNLAVTGGGTALNDAALSGIEAVEAEGGRLDGLDFGVNAVTFVITDGEENSSSVARKGNERKIKDALIRARKAEKLESVKTILIGVGQRDANNDAADARTQAFLDEFKDKAGFDQYEWAGSATPGNLAKLANFVSRSVSSSSQALGTGGQSQNLSF